MNFPGISPDGFRLDREIRGLGRASLSLRYGLFLAVVPCGAVFGYWRFGPTGACAGGFLLLLGANLLARALHAAVLEPKRHRHLARIEMLLARNVRNRVSGRGLIQSWRSPRPAASARQAMRSGQPNENPIASASGPATPQYP